MRTLIIGPIRIDVVTAVKLFNIGPIRIDVVTTAVTLFNVTFSINRRAKTLLALRNWAQKRIFVRMRSLVKSKRDHRRIAGAANAAADRMTFRFMRFHVRIQR